GRIPVTGILLSILNLDGGNFFAANQWIEVQEPLFTKQTNIQIYPIQRPEYPYRVGAVFEHVGCPHRIWRLEKLRQTGSAGVIVELFIFEVPTRQFFLPPQQGRSQARSNAVDGVHRARIVDRVGGDERRVQGSWQGGMKQLIDKV